MNLLKRFVQLLIPSAKYISKSEKYGTTSFTKLILYVIEWLHNNFRTTVPFKQSLRPCKYDVLNNPIGSGMRREQFLLSSTEIEFDPLQHITNIRPDYVTSEKFLKHRTDIVLKKFIISHVI